MKFEIKDGTILEGEPIEEKSSKLKPTPNEEVAMGSYLFMSDIDWDKKEEILITDKPKQKIFVNQKFADKSVFGDECVFIKCKFGSDCEFGFDCEKTKPYWNEEGKHE